MVVDSPATRVRCKCLSSTLSSHSPRAPRTKWRLFFTDQVFLGAPLRFLRYEDDETPNKGKGCEIIDRLNKKLSYMIRRRFLLTLTRAFSGAIALLLFTLVHAQSPQTALIRV